MTRFLICGLGSIGRRHLRNLRLLGEQDIVLLRTGRSTLPDDDLASLPVVDSMDQALDRHSLDAAIIANPTAMHVDLSIEAAKAGLHLLIEKPVSHELHGLDELEEMVRSSQVRTLIGYQYRYHPGLRQIKDEIVNGSIGKPLAAHAHYGEYLPDWHPWEDYRQSYAARADMGGGVVLTLSHPLHYLSWLFGDVSVVGATMCNSGALEVEVDDTAAVTLTFANGMVGSVHLNYIQRPRRHDLEIIGSKGTLRWTESEPAVQRWSQDTERWEHAAVANADDRNWMFIEEMKHFIELTHGHVDSRCPLECGIKVLKVALAAKESASRGERVIF